MTEFAGLRVVGSLPSGAPGESLVASLPAADGAVRPVIIRRVSHAGTPAGAENAARDLEKARLVQHPNVVPVLQVVPDGAGVAGVYTGLPGITLAVLLREAAITATPIPGPLAVHLVAEVCKGLHAIHEAADLSGGPLNLVHGDLTPDSVWLTWDGAVRVMDLGVANPSVPARATEGSESRMWFVPPEMARGEAPDRRSDVYGAAAILYRLVTGRPPYTGSSPAETLALIRDSAVPDARALAPMLPPALGDMLSTGMSKNPAERFQSAAAFAATLVRFLELARLNAGAADLAAFMGRLMPEGHPLRAAWTNPVVQAAQDAAGAGEPSSPGLAPVDPSAFAAGGDGASLPGGMAASRTGTLLQTPLPAAVPQPVEQAVVAPEDDMPLSALAERERSRQDLLAGMNALSGEIDVGMPGSTPLAVPAPVIPGSAVPDEISSLSAAPPRMPPPVPVMSDAPPPLAGVVLPLDEPAPVAVAASAPPVPPPGSFSQPAERAPSLPASAVAPAEALVPPGQAAAPPPAAEKSSGGTMAMLAAGLALIVGGGWFFVMGPGAAMLKGEGGEVARGPDVPPTADPPRQDPVKAEPPKEEPVKVDPPKEEPVKAEPPKEEPVKAEPPKEEPVKAEPPKEEPVKVEPPKEEPVKAEPPKEEPGKPKPAKGSPVLKYPKDMGAVLVEAPAGTAVWINGKKLFEAPVDPLYFREGTYRFMLVKGKTRVKEAVSVVKGEAAVVTLDPDAAPAGDAAPPPPPPPPPPN